MNCEPGRRIFGIETEFGTLVADPELGSPEEAVEAIKDTVFNDFKLGLIDLHARDDVFEPARSGGFLLNGARLYVDAVGSHLEYATAECRQLKDVIANDRAGQRQIVRAIKELELQNEVFVYNNSIDHFGGHTFGCHENYLVRADESLFGEGMSVFYPFLVTRQIFAGVGRVGGHILTNEFRRPTYEDVAANPVDYIWVSQVYGVIPDDSVTFQLSQRADHILKTVASRVRFNRALINPKWEHYYTYDGMTRLHLLFGEANQNEFAYALKVGTTCLMLDLMEDGRIPSDWLLMSPIRALREVSRDETYRWVVQMLDGSTIPAVDLQRRYLKLAQAYRGASADLDWTLDAWEATLDGLEQDPMLLADRLDWVAKKKIVDTYRAEMDVDWSHDALHSVDLEYHNIDPEQSLFYGYDKVEGSQRICDDLDIVDAMTDPPRDTRASGRSKIILSILKSNRPRTYMIDWNGIAVNRQTYYEMTDPLDPYDELAAKLTS